MVVASVKRKYEADTEDFKSQVRNKYFNTVLRIFQSKGAKTSQMRDKLEKIEKAYQEKKLQHRLRYLKKRQEEEDLRLAYAREIEQKSNRQAKVRLMSVRNLQKTYSVYFNRALIRTSVRSWQN